MKTCRKCQLTKTEAEFPFQNKEKGTLDSWCKSCHKGYQKDHYERTKHRYKKTRNESNVRRREALKRFIEDFKTSRGCQICGWNKHSCGLDFHHVDGDKENNVGSMNSSSLKRVKAEMMKCIVLCACCHRMVHHSPHLLPNEELT